MSGDPNAPKPGQPTADFPDLDLGPVAAPKPAAQPAPAAPAPPKPKPPPAAGGAGALDYFGTGFDEDHFDAGSGGSTAHMAPSGAYEGGSFDFDDEPVEGKSVGLELASYRPPSADGSLAPQAGTLAPAPGAPAAPSAPSLRAAARAPAPVVDVDDTAAALLAGYGPSPKSIVLTPMYAWRVINRQRALRARLTALASEITVQERQRDGLLAELAQSMRPTWQADPRWASQLASIEQIEQIAGERGAELQRVHQQLQAQASAAAGQRSGIEAQVAERRAVEQAAAAELGRREESLARASAKQKRFQIEERAIMQAAQQAGGQAAQLSAEQAAKVHELRAQSAALEPEVARARQEMESAKAELQGVQRGIAQLRDQIQRIDAQQRANEQALRRQIDQRAAGASEAQNNLTAALAEVARGVLVAREAAVDPERMRAIQAAEDAVKRSIVSREQHLRALDLHDRASVQRGIALAAGASLLAIALLVWLILAGAR